QDGCQCGTYPHIAPGIVAQIEDQLVGSRLFKCLECPLELRLVPRVERIVKKVCRWSGHPVEHLVEIDRVFCRRPGGEWHAALVFDIQRDAVLCYRCTDQLLYIAFG